VERNLFLLRMLRTTRITRITTTRFRLENQFSLLYIHMAIGSFDLQVHSNANSYCLLKLYVKVLTTLEVKLLEGSVRMEIGQLKNSCRISKLALKP